MRSEVAQDWNLKQLKLILDFIGKFFTFYWEFYVISHIGDCLQRVISTRGAVE